MTLNALRKTLGWRLRQRGRYVVFYDANCALCRRTRGWLERAGLDAPIQFVDVNDRTAMARWPRIDFHRAQHEVFVLDPAGRLWGGYGAALRLVQGVKPRLRNLDWLLRSTPAQWLGTHTYDWISGHRYQLSRRLFQEKEGRRTRPRPPGRKRRSTPMGKQDGRQERRQINFLKGAVAGTIGGLVAAWAMEQAQVMVKELAQRQRDGQRRAGDGQQAQPPEQRTKEQLSQEQPYEQEPATVKAAEAVSQRLFHRKLAEEVKPAAGETMHYGFGASMGGLYGVLAELLPAVTTRGGLAYGTAVWAIADEIGVPAAGLAAPPNQQPPRAHAYALGSHLVFGLTLEIVRRTTRWLLR